MSKVLIINKFLYPNGGSETYIFKLGECLERLGHEVQYFGMEHEGRIVGNRVEAYTSDMDFHGGSKLAKLTYPFKTIYSSEARKQIRKVLDDFRPDICHLNNFNYQLTPSVILEIVKWRKETGRDCQIYYTAHDYQLVCPNHMMNNPATHENCEKCVGRHFGNCIKGKCIHGSTAKSIVGAAEAFYWNLRGTYRYIDKIICCSEFMKTKLDTNPVLAERTVAVHNFLDASAIEAYLEKNSGDAKTNTGDVEHENLGHNKKQGYVLYFGRYSWEKGVRTLIDAAKKLPDIKFVCAGRGEYADQMKVVINIEDVGFQSGDDLIRLIHEAKFSVCPSECYENNPFSVMESCKCGTPVIGARIGGIPELVIDRENGLLFESGNVDDLAEKIQGLWSDEDMLRYFEKQCREVEYDTAEEYVRKAYDFT
jgi:glycosyltransferase involved in cell wall biosynthesis